MTKSRNILFVLYLCIFTVAILTIIGIMPVVNAQTTTQVTLDFDGGKGSQSTVEVTADANLPTLEQLPSKMGYTFDGYYTAPNGAGTLYYDNLGVGQVIFTVESATTLFASWTPITYSIDLYHQGTYVDTIANVSYGHLVLPTATELSLTKENHVFVGWNIHDQQDWAMYYGNKEYNVGLTTTQDAVVTLYSAWQETPKASVTYNANGGYNAPTDVNSYYVGSQVAISEVLPMRDEYDFVGWTYDPHVSTVAFPYVDGAFETTTFTMPTDGVTLYAKWKANQTLQAQIDQANQDISALQSNLDVAVETLNQSITNGDNNIAIQITNVESAYQSADTMLNEKITTLAQKDDTLKANVDNLQEALQNADSELQNAINDIKNQLANDIAILNQSITDGDNNLQGKIDALVTDYQNADAFLSGEIANLTTTNIQVSADLTSLATTVGETDEQLQIAIDNLQRNLNNAVNQLQNDILASDVDLHQQIEQVVKDYQTADQLLQSQLATFSQKDDELQQSIFNLQASLNTSQNTLQQAIADVQTNLDNAVTSLNQSITDGDTELQRQIDGVDLAYQNADTILSSQIATLTSANQQLEQQFESLQNTLTVTDVQLQNAVDTLQKNLNDAVGQLTQDIANNASDLQSKIDAVDLAYRNAELISQGDIELLKQADEQLNIAVNTLQSKLNNAIADLNKAIADGDKDLQSKIDSLKVALENATGFSTSEIPSIKQSLASLQSDYEQADQTMQNAIDKLQQDLLETQAQLDSLQLSNTIILSVGIVAVVSAELFGLLKIFKKKK